MEGEKSVRDGGQARKRERQPAVVSNREESAGTIETLESARLLRSEMDTIDHDINLNINLNSEYKSRQSTTNKFKSPTAMPRHEFRPANPALAQERSNVQAGR